MIPTGWTFPILAAAALMCAHPGVAQTVDRDSVGRIHVHPGLGVRVGMPQRVSVALGLVAGADFKTGSHPRSPDVAVYVEPGWSAGRATVGMTTGFGRMGAGWGAGATVLRTWRDAWGMPDNTTYAGVEAWIWPVFFIGPRIGLFHAVGGQRQGGWRIVGDFGVGL